MFGPELKAWHLELMYMVVREGWGQICFPLLMEEVTLFYFFPEPGQCGDCVYFECYWNHYNRTYELEACLHLVSGEPYFCWDAGLQYFQV